MPVTQQELGRRLREARESCQMTRGKVADYLGVSRFRVAQIEAGRRSVSSLELSRLADFFDRNVREFVTEVFEETDALGAFLFRHPKVLEAVAVETLRRCLALGRQITSLERMIGIDSGMVATVSYSLPLPTSPWKAVEHGERLACDERRRLGLGNAPLPDLTELLESEGVRTGAIDLPADVSGLILEDPSVGLLVVVNRKQDPLRRRFSFAHEYAHVLADRIRFGVVSRSSEKSNLIEMRADAFAACFLMPESGVRHFLAGLGKGRPVRTGGASSQVLQMYDIVRLAHHFGVSRLTALYRLRHLKILSRSRLDRLKQLDDSGQGEQLAEHLGLPELDQAQTLLALQHRVVGLALEAYRRAEISRGNVDEIIRLFGIQPDRVEAILVDAGLLREAELAETWS